MSILLAIETSSGDYRIALGRDRKLQYDSAQRGGPPSRDLVNLVSEGLKSVAAEIGDVSGITVNIGPGGLSYVRSGVSFANALSFSLGIPIYPFNTFQILGCEAAKDTDLPLLCAIPAANGNAYAGIVRGAAVHMMRFGPLPDAVARVLDGLAEVAIAGKVLRSAPDILKGVKMVDTQIEKPNAGILLEMGYRASDQAGVPVTQVTPLTEQAAVFY